MGRGTMAAAIIYRQMLPSSAFFALFPRYLRNPGPSSLFEAVRSGFQILGLTPSQTPDFGNSRHPQPDPERPSPHAFR